MAKQSSMLSHLQIAAPCPASWDKMEGNNRVRFCKECNLNVYNLSELSTKAAEQLILENEGKLCVRMYRRKDGTIITENCPVGLRWIKDKIKFTRILAASCLSWIMSFCRVQGQEFHENVAVEFRTNTVQDLMDNTDCSDVLVLTKQSQQISSVNSISNSDTVVFAESNAQVTRNGRCLELKRGKLVLLTSRLAENLRFQFGTVEIPKNACVIVEAKSNDRIRVANLLGGELATKIQMGKNASVRTITTKAGEEICISTETDIENDLIPNDDGVDREPIVGGCCIPGTVMRVSTFDTATMFEKQPLLTCTNATQKGIRRLVSRVRKKILSEEKPLSLGGKPLMEMPAAPPKNSKKK